MKYFALLCTLLFISTFSFAQQTEASTNKIRIKVNGDQLRVEADGQNIDLDYSFDKEKTWDLINAFNRHLDVPASTDVTNGIYSATAKGYDIRIRSGKLTMDLDKTKLSDETGQQLISAVQDALSVFGIDIQTSLTWGE